ncbi:MAG: hypothetical protein ABI629_02115 [bacterium]
MIGFPSWRTRSIHTATAVAAAVVLTAAWAQPARAVRAHLSSFETTYPDAAGTRLDACGLCHGALPARNAYGSAY